MTEGSRVRLAVVGVVVIAVFSALFARLWFLQVVTGNEVAAAVQTNSVRTVRIPAPRGDIFDVKGNLLVDNAVVNAITVRRSLIGKQRTEVVDRLSQLLHKTVAQIEKNLNDPRVSPYSAVPVATNVPFDQLAYVKEHQADFPSVDAVSLTVRRYHLWGTGKDAVPVAPQVLGYIGEINGDELKARKGEGYALGDIVGKTGVEQSMESELRGTAGYDKLEVDNTGRVVRVIGHKDPVPGDNVYLTIDANVQGLAQKTLNDAMTQDRPLRDPSIKDRFQTFNAPGGAFVLLDAHDGSVVAMASEPDYNPNDFVQGNGIPTPTWEWLNDPAHAYPLNNRAIQGLYAPGSTFKLITATGMLQSGFRGPNTPYTDTGSVKCCNNDVFRNDNGRQYGRIDLSQALTVSSDAYFYTVGLQFWQLFHAGLGGNFIQDAARSYGFGSPTGVALADESRGRVPDEAWKIAYNKNNPDPVSKAANSVWQPGDNIHLAVGQGDLVVTPLQLASAYMAFADGGTRWVPRIVDHVTDYRGHMIRTYPAVQKPSVQLPAGSDAIMAGLEGVTADPKGTAFTAFQGFPLADIPVMAKTGTAQVQGKSATSVFVAVSNPGRPTPSFVAASFMEEAGYGAAVSAPIVRHVLNAMYGLPNPPNVTIDATANTAVGN